ncbi:hypothetical protein L1987_18130 [Smallanthus sonchifolius]|uniref:Uncharacterized protein n=1 Tax=Smallanthus sonchifolius TaxID=185202 RepID=A0ACB9J116_9ASTR|nr:hypothetical protein L1987_18130 [Smallanthus sonchifolius]
MNSGPGLFSDIGKKATDLLTKDYISDQKFSVSTSSVTGVALTSTATKKGGLSSGDVGAVYKYKNTLTDIKLDTESNIATKLTFTDIVPSTKTIASFKLPDLKSSKVETVVGEISRRFLTNENTFTVGGSYAVDHLTMVKAKLNNHGKLSNHGKLGAVLQHEIIPKSLVTMSTEVDTRALDRTPKFGLALALKP